jgi:hypothetical protein
VKPGSTKLAQLPYRPLRAPLPRDAADRDGAERDGALRDMPLCEFDGLRRIVLPPLGGSDFHVEDWFVGRLFTFRLPGVGVLMGRTDTGCGRTVRGLEGLVRTVL